MSTYDGRYIDPTVFEDWSRPVERVYAELYCLARTVMPSEQTRTRAVATLLLIGVWATIVLGIELTHPIVTLKYGAGPELRYLITALVFTIIGRMWGVEVDHIVGSLGIQSDTDSSDDSDDYHSPPEFDDETDDYPR